MATKTIAGKVTLHVPGKNFKPFEFSDSGVAKSGVYDIEQVPPGNPVILDENEANRLISLGLAEEYTAPAPTEVPVPVDGAGTSTKTVKTAA